MKGKIDKDGFLWIERKGEWTKQFCPFVGDCNDWCGQWCPLFGEPEFIDGHPRFIDGHPRLSLCRKVLEFVSLVDERGQE